MSTQRLLVVEHVPVDRLRPDPANPRRVSDAALDELDRSIEHFGLLQPVVARREDGMVIAGHQRLVSARRLGHTVVPVAWVDLPLDECRLLALRLNTSTGTWDEQLLARLVADLHAKPQIDLSLSGFASEEIGDLLRGLATREKRDRPESFDLDGELERVTRELRTKPGDVWALGDHRLLCGDATNAEAIDRLLAGKRAAMAFTDPPYGVDLGNHGGRPRGARRRTMSNDALEPAAWEAFVRGFARNLVAATDGGIYIAMSSKEWPLVARVLAEEGGHWSDTIVWAKDRFVLGRADYQRAYEPIWYGWREGAKRHWSGARDQSDVWQIERPADSPLHPVMKPLELMERAIRNSSRDGDLVLDPFAGSGSTIIATERTGRRCAALELDPVFVDVAVARWERFTGETAERLDA